MLPYFQIFMKPNGQIKSFIKSLHVKRTLCCQINQSEHTVNIQYIAQS